MISRKTALLIGENVATLFVKEHKSWTRGYNRRQNISYSIDTDTLYDFFYTNDYSAWLCNSAKQARDFSESRSNASRKVKELVLKLHTGETQAAATQNWTGRQREKLGQEYLFNLAEDVLKYSSGAISRTYKTNPTLIENLKKSLELDGYVFDGTRLLVPEESVLDVEEETSLLKNLYLSLNLGRSDVVFHHLSLSEEHYQAEKWEDTIANSRKFLECVLQQIAVVYSEKFDGRRLPDSAIEKPVQIRNYLEEKGLIEKQEGEANAKIYGLLSHTGSHPYMAQSDQARLLRHLALTLSQFILLRMKGAITNENGASKIVNSLL